MVSLGQRLNWAQVGTLLGPVQDQETLRLLTQLVRKHEERLPLIFTSVQLSGRPDKVVKYLMTYGNTGLDDLNETLRFGSGALRELFARNQRLYTSSVPYQLGVDLAWRLPGLAIALRWLMLLAGGFLLAASIHYWRTVPLLEQPLQVRGFH